MILVISNNLLKKIGTNPGQVTIINLLVILMVMIMYFVFLPILVQFTNANGVPAIANSTADQPTKDITIAIIQLFPVGIAIAVLMTILNYARPREAGG
jgi:hypothetical protein